MEEGADRLVAFGYLVILGLLAGLILLCFIWGVWEYTKPKDSGPLFIDLDRTIDERSEALILRSSLGALLEEKDLWLVKEKVKPQWLKRSKVLSKVSVVEKEIKEIWSVDGNLSIPKGAKLDKVLVVNGDLKTGNNCTLHYIYVIGSAVIGARNNLHAITTRGNLTIRMGTTVKRFADADGELKIGNGSTILGSATSASMITIEDRCTLKKIHSPVGYRVGINAVSESSTRSIKTLKRAELMERIQWNPKMDELIKERFDKVSVDKLSREIKDCLKIQVPTNIILRRARMLGLIGRASTKLNSEQKPKYLESATVWMQEAETIRVRGDIRIPKEEVIPYNMIVEGNLTSEHDVTFQGGLHIKGRGIIGARNLLEKSIVCQKELVLLEDVMVHNCVDCEGLVFIKKGAMIGVGVEGGGITSTNTICLEGAEGAQKIYSREEIRTVKSIKEVIHGDLKPNN